MNLGNRFSQHQFAKVPQANMARSRFDRSFGTKDTFNFDELTPLFVDEMLPGDTVNLNVKLFARLAPQVRPLLDNMYLDVFFFWVPNRLVWTNWVKLMGERKNPLDPVDYLVPTVTSGLSSPFAVGSIYDHLGIPTGVNNVVVNALPLRAINLIWNEWFRDQNLQNSVQVLMTDGPDPEGTYTMLKRAKKHDYFTSALPWPQKGTAVSIPLGTTAPVSMTIPGQAVQVRTAGAGGGSLLATQANGSGGVQPMQLASNPGGNSGLNFWNPQITNLSGSADLSAATAATINAIRQAFMMQSLLELDARAGTRYVEVVKAHFNVTLPDFTAQRPEFLSGATIRVNQHPIAQTSETGGTPQGNLAAYSTAAEFGNKAGFSKSFHEHGYVIGFIQARADVTYQQGLNRMWSRQTRWDFFWPKFQELGEQAILNKEIYYQNTAADNQVFGYIPRHDEYRFYPSMIKGQFRSTFAQSLDVWHLAQEFSALPVLNSTFIQSSTPIERVLEVPDPAYPDLLLDAWFDYKHIRPMVTYANPASLGRF